MIIALLTIGKLNAKEVKVGEIVPQFEIELLDGNKFSNPDLKGKVTVFDMWATWCSPCIGSMKKLSALTNKFKGSFQVVAVSSEDHDRIGEFADKMGFDINFTVDHQTLMNFFPHRVIPHAVLIDQNGKVVAITSPANITEVVVKQLIGRQSVALPLKADNLSFSFTEDYFKMDTTTQESFIVQSGIPGIGSYSMLPGRGPFAERRISIFNFPIDGLYRLAYQTTAYRMSYEVDESMFEYDNPENLYALDLIVKPDQKEEMYELLKEKVAASFPIKARMEMQKQEVIVMSRIEGEPIKLKPADKKISGGSGGDHFRSSDTLEAFAQYLEGYGIVGMAVVDETNLDGLYEIDFRFSPEDPSTFHTALKEMGLQLNRVVREIEILVIYQ